MHTVWVADKPITGYRDPRCTNWEKLGKDLIAI